MQYQIIYTTYTEDLIDQVNAQLALGWVCLGGPFYDEGGYGQAMTKTN